MCSIWKFVGVAALSVSIFYSFVIWLVVLTFVLRCYDDCNSGQPAAYPEDCYSTFAIYTLYVPTVFAAPFITKPDGNSIYYLQWWLLIHAVLTCCSFFLYICYSPFYTPLVSDINILGIACLLFTFAIVAYHFLTLIREPKTENSSELNA